MFDGSVLNLVKSVATATFFTSFGRLKITESKRSKQLMSIVGGVISKAD
jgi:hypothetical protein